MRDLTPPMKVSISFFILFTILGLATSLMLQHQQTAFASGQAASYYRGNADDEQAKVYFVEKSYRQLLETAHFHVYIMPLYYLAFVHVFFLTDRSEREKIWLSVITFTGVLLEMLLPWLIRYVSPALGGLFWLSGLAITIPTLWMSAICLRELWSGKEEDEGVEL